MCTEAHPVSPGKLKKPWLETVKMSNLKVETNSSVFSHCTVKAQQDVCLNKRTL